MWSCHTISSNGRYMWWAPLKLVHKSFILVPFAYMVYRFFCVFSSAHIAFKFRVSVAVIPRRNLKKIRMKKYFFFLEKNNFGSVDIFFEKKNFRENLKKKWKIANFRKFWNFEFPKIFDFWKNIFRFCLKKYFFEIEKKVVHSFDVKNRDLSFYELFIAIPELTGRFLELFPARHRY